MSASASAACGSAVAPCKHDALGMPHRLRARSDGTRRIDGAPDRNANIVAGQAIDGVEKSRMHLHEVDGAEIGDGRLALARRPLPLRAGKAEAAIDDREFAFRRAGRRATAAMSSEASVEKTKRMASCINAGRNHRRLHARNMRPKHAAHRGKAAARQAFEQARMIPELELDDIGRGGQLRHLIEAFGNDDARPALRDHIRVAAIARLFEQDKSLLHLRRQCGRVSPHAPCRRRRRGAA